MRPLRYRRLWALGAWTGVALAVFLTVVPSRAAPFPVGGPVQHITGYFLMTSWFLGIYPRRAYLPIALGCLAFGGAMELLQFLSPSRHPSLTDALRNGLGIAPALVLGYLGLGGWAARLEDALGLAPPER